jgi:ribosomal protein S26
MQRQNYNPYRAPRMYNPTLYYFDCHYGSRILKVRAEGPYAAREKAAKYFKCGEDKIVARKV